MRPPSKLVKWSDRPIKRWTLQRCLVKLGADPTKVYFGGRHGKPYQVKSNLKKHVRTIYTEYDLDFLVEWVQTLWKHGRKYHPNQHNRSKKFYTRKFQDLSEAYEKAKKILGHHGIRF